MTTIQSLLEEFTVASRSHRDKGDLFERLIANYLLIDPQYANRLSDVWLWNDWSYRWGIDDGIDIVARERNSGEFWAIQCKFYDANHIVQKSDIDSFFTASGKQFMVDGVEHSFATRLIVSTTDRWSSVAEKALENQTIPVSRLRVQDLANSPIDWSQFSLSNIKDLRLRKRKELREHQREAVNAALDGFKTDDRGKLIMACGTGKTLTSLRLAEEQVPNQGRILFLAPSISLISQSLREWTAESIHPFHAFVVCSDSKVGKEHEDIRTHDLAYPPTTNSRKLINAMSGITTDRKTIIFSTYQSIQVIVDAQRQGMDEFDLIICDEAHRTTGIAVGKETVSDFVKVHDQTAVLGKKRLYMTATPRIYADKSKSKANELDAALYSMDDESIYGRDFFRLGFGKAVQKNLLADYKVLIVAVDDDLIAPLVNQYNAYKLSGKKAISSEFAAKIIGSWKGLSKREITLVGDEGLENLQEDIAPMKRAVAFSRSIKNSQEATEAFSQLVRLYVESHEGTLDDLVHCSLDHVDGGMNALKRQNALEWLKEDTEEGECRILSNARCLSEGIDVPALDAVIFFDTRDSMVDIVQSVGRVMRKSGDKQYGYIILPVGIPMSKIKDYNSYVESDDRFKGIWKVIKALRAHDESLVDETEFRKKIQIYGELNGQDHGKEERKDDSGEQGEWGFSEVPIEAISKAVYGVIPKKLGDTEYWTDWAKNVASISDRIISRILDLLSMPEAREAFHVFLKGLRENLNPAVTEEEAVEMLAQHVITRPIFDALFDGYSFTKNNPVSRSMQSMIEMMDHHVMDSEIEGLNRFYAHVKERVSLAKSDKSRQEVIRNLYDTFFNHAFPRMAERLGIVYTPVEVVDFIIHSVEAALRKHFKMGITERGVQVLDPFTGTGTFMVRLLQSGLIRSEDLLFKYQNELHANEIVLLAYYIASINIESALHAVQGEYAPFDGIVLTDTFQMAENRDWVDDVTMPENSDRVNRQKQQDIRVILGNPPYSAGQKNANDNNQNLAYPTLDGRIRDTYAAKSSATNKNSLYDSYIRAIRWASDRIKNQGIVAFVTNGSFIDNNAAEGLRKCLVDEYSHIYVFNLRGNQRTSGELSKEEGGKIFGSGSRAPVAITVLIKEPAHTGACVLLYHDIGDYLSREEKLRIIDDFQSIDNISWQEIKPNLAGDWINQRDQKFVEFMDLKDIYTLKSRGVETNRDAWVYNYSHIAIETNIQRMIDNYNREVEKYSRVCETQPKESWPSFERIVDDDPKNISWSRALKEYGIRNVRFQFSGNYIVASLYRPFNKQWLYFNRNLNEYVNQWPKIISVPEHNNFVITVTGIGASKPFSTLVTNAIPNLHMHDTGQCFPLYWYEKVDGKSTFEQDQIEMFESGDKHAHHEGYIRHDAITDWAIDHFRQYYGDTTIKKEDLFWYVYGVLNSPEYRQRFASNLKKMLPRIPFVADFWAFSNAGRKLGDVHLNYENVEPYPLMEHGEIVMDDDRYRVKKMSFGKSNGRADKSVIHYNEYLSLSGIPLEAYEYVVNGKSAIEWIMERYAVTTDKESGILNDPNEWSGDPRYIVDLLKRIVRVSLESVTIINDLPALNEDQNPNHSP